MVALLLATTFWMPWQVVLTLQVGRMELGFGPYSLVNLTAPAGDHQDTSAVATP